MNRERIICVCVDMCIISKFSYVSILVAYNDEYEGNNCNDENATDGFKCTLTHLNFFFPQMRFSSQFLRQQTRICNITDEVSSSDCNSVGGCRDSPTRGGQWPSPRLEQENRGRGVRKRATAVRPQRRAQLWVHGAEPTPAVRCVCA